MCRVTTATSSSTSSSSTDNEDRHVTNPKVRLLVTLESFHHDEYKKPCLPNKISCFITTIVILIGLFLSEYIWRYIITSYQHVHPLLDNEIHRNILARHIGVDTVCCIICVLLGLATRHAVQDVFRAVLGGTNKKAPVKTSDNDKPTDDDTVHPMPVSKYQERLLQFEAGSFRLALFFFIYQIKNTYDTILWNDGPEFIFHHVFSMITAYGCMFAPTIGHMYAVFFFGLSELSTAVLCLLANFDDVHGVPGLGDALPNVKVILAVVFTICFILCRVIIWPIFAYYFCRDVLLTLKHDEKERNKNNNTAQTKHYRGLPRSWLYFFLISLSGISCLQVAWLGQIFILGQQELNKMGYI